MNQLHDNPSDDDTTDLDDEIAFIPDINLDTRDNEYPTIVTLLPDVYQYGYDKGYKDGNEGGMAISEHMNKQAAVYLSQMVSDYQARLIQTGATRDYLTKTDISAGRLIGASRFTSAIDYVYNVGDTVAAANNEFMDSLDAEVTLQSLNYAVSIAAVLGVLSLRGVTAHKEHSLEAFSEGLEHLDDFSYNPDDFPDA